MKIALQGLAWSMRVGTVSVLLECSFGELALQRSWRTFPPALEAAITSSSFCTSSPVAAVVDFRRR